MNKTRLIKTVAPFYLLLVASVLILSPPAVAQTSTYNFKWSPELVFKLPAYNTWVGFSDWVYLNGWEWDSFNATTITLYDVKMGEGPNIPQLTISIIGGNMTITQLFYNHELKATVHGETGVPVIIMIDQTLYSGMPSKVTIEGSSYIPLSSRTDFDSCDHPCWYFNQAENQIYIKVVPHSDVLITVTYASIPSPGPAPAPSPMQVTPTAPAPTPAPQPPFKLTPQNIAIILIAAAIIILFIPLPKRRR